MRRAGMMKRWAQYGAAALVVAALTVALRFLPLPGDGPVSRLARDALLSAPLYLSSPDESEPDESEEETSENRLPPSQQAPVSAAMPSRRVCEDSEAAMHTAKACEAC